MACNKPLAESIRRGFKKTKEETWPASPPRPEVPVTNPYLGSTCRRHRATYNHQYCGLLLSRHFADVSKYVSSIVDIGITLTGVSSIPEFILSVGHLPTDISDIVFDRLLPTRLRGEKNCRKLWLNPTNLIQYRDWIPFPQTIQPFRVSGIGKETQFCYIQGIVEQLHQISQKQDGVFNPRLLEGKTYREVAQELRNKFLAYVGKNLVVQLFCYEGINHPPQEACQAFYVLERTC